MSDEPDAPEVDPFDPSAYPEEARELAEQAAARYREAQEQASRWEGITHDPTFVKEAVDQWSALRDPQRYRQALEGIMHSYQILPEDVTLDQARQVVQWWQSTDEPDAAAGADATPAQGDVLTRADAERMLQEALAAQQARLDEQQQADWGYQQLQQQEAGLRSRLEQEGVDLGETGWRALRGLIQSRLQSGEVTEQNFASTVEDTYKLLDAVATARAGALVKKQAGAPATRAGAGAPAGHGKPVDGFDAMRARMQEIWTEANTD